MSSSVRDAPSAAKAAEPSEATLAAVPRGCSNFRLRQIDRVVSRHYDQVMAQGAGLKTSQYSLLSHLAAAEPVRPADLADHMGLEPSTLTRNLQPLVAQGWVESGPGPDGRTRLLRLTPAGRDKRQQAQRVWKRAQLSFNQRLGVERVLALHSLIDECLLQLSRSTPPEEPPHD